MLPARLRNLQMSDDTTAPIPAPPVPDASAPEACGNCGRPLLGDYCYACGQPVKGLVRHFTSIVGDFADTVLDYDARLPRTLWPLFGRPAFLTREYFAGRRVRYVSPVRLFFMLSIVTFFVAQLMLSFGDNALSFNDPDKVSYASATTVEEVIAQRDKALAEFENARKQAATGVPAVNTGLDVAEKMIRNGADARIAAIRKQQAAGKPVTAAPDDENSISFNGKAWAWDPKTNPLAVSWWPDFANRWLNNQVGRAKTNIKRMQADPSLFKDAFLGAVPSTLFVLLPLFALMLKLLYLFRKHLYMEHLMVALHSHAFLCLALLLIFATTALRDWLASGAGFWHGTLGWIIGLLWAWMPIYLLLMQKRVYAQGWPMTLLKYSVLGIAYLILLSIGATFTVLLSVVYA